MLIEKCLKNIRCDTGACHQMAKFNINTSSYKGSIYLCEKCFKELYNLMLKMKKEYTSKETKGNN
ncbi:MAG: hypothetical protein IJB98_03320 [Clostridia bacterium]|nr:hypothetical protein [Clostridia bacterium]